MARRSPAELRATWSTTIFSLFHIQPHQLHCHLPSCFGGVIEQPNPSASHGGVDPAHITPSTPPPEWRVPGHSVIPRMGAEELFWRAIYFTFPGDTESSDVLWHMEAVHYLHLNICLPIVTPIWNIYTLFILLLSSSPLLLSSSFAVLTTAPLL